MGTWWLSRRPLGKENGDCKLIYTFVIYLLIPCKHLGRIKTYTFLKIILLYIVATMTNDTIRMWWVPSSSSDEVEEHSMAPEDPRAAVVGLPPLKHKK